MTYQELKTKLEEMTATMNVYNAVASCGVPQKNVHHWRSPEILSGYSMGEEVRIMCGDVTIQDIDQRKYYAKSCKWNEKHGYILVNLSKADVRKYVQLCAQLEDNALPLASSMELKQQAKDIIARRINTDRSQIKSLTIFCS